MNLKLQIGKVPGGKMVRVTYKIGAPPITDDPTRLATHRVKTDFENGRTNRPQLPMVSVFDERKVSLTKEWQMYFVACNYTMVDNNISRAWDDNVAFCNNTGFHGSHNRRNYILMEDLDNDLPQLDKTRICGDARFHMEGTSVLCMDGTSNPLLKPGAVHPQNTAEAHGAFDRYLYNPRDNPCLFFPATVTGNDFHAHPWPMKEGTGRYSWWRDGTEPVLWMFLVAPMAQITYPPQQWTDNTPYIEEL